MCPNSCSSSPLCSDASGGAAPPVGPAAAEDQGEGRASAAGPEAGAVPARVRGCPRLDQRQGQTDKYQI